MRPCPSDGLPVMGKVPEVEGAYISCGHNCWGILWAPASGLAVAELMATGTSSTLNLQHFSPDRFDRAGAASRRGKKKGSVEVGEQW
jgi:glycine/D-amino acid oxidase-like deaminating enzyme